MRLLDFSAALEAVAVAAVSVVVDNSVNLVAYNELQLMTDPQKLFDILYEEFVCLDDAVCTRVGLACTLHGRMILPRLPFVYRPNYVC